MADNDNSSILGTLGILALLFLLYKFLTQGSSAFSLGQAVPMSPADTAIPFSTQDQVSANPVATPAPWASACATVNPPPASGIALVSTSSVPVAFPTAAATSLQA